MVYSAENESLAALELLVHLQSSHLLVSYCSIWIDLDGIPSETVDIATLPTEWRDYPAPSALQRIGDRWASAQSPVVLQVPSAIVPNEVNYLLNPRHPNFVDLRFGEPVPFQFAPRLK